MAAPDIHSRSLATSTQLMQYYVKKAVLPSDVFSALNEARFPFVLVGTHGLGGWITKPRTTIDVDIIVASRTVKKAVKALLGAFPQLEAADSRVANHLRDRETHAVAIDVIKPTRPLFRAAPRNAHTVIIEDQSYRIPTLEMALAMKFAAMCDPDRDCCDKHQDAHDFICMAKFNANIDLEKLAELGSLVHATGSKELLEKLRGVRAGEKFNL